MEKLVILILGSGHLPIKVKELLAAKNHKVTHIPSEEFKDAENFLNTKSILEQSDIARAKAVFILDNDDGRNIHFSLAAVALSENAQIFVSLHNKNLSRHFKTAHKNIRILNPAAVAAPNFIEALCVNVEAKNTPKEDVSVGDMLGYSRVDNLVRKLLLGFGAILLGGTFFFMLSENVSFLDALYLITTVITSVNFSDVSLKNYGAGLKVTRIIILLGVQFFILLTFSFIIDQIIKKRTEIYTLGRRKHNLKNHVIVCGLGRLGFNIVEKLLEKSEKVLVIESNPDNKFLESIRSKGAVVLIGDASLPKNLKDAGIDTTVGLICAVDNDLENLEVGLNARLLRPNLRLILRIFDKYVAEEIKPRLNINFALSTSSIAAEEFVKLFESSLKNS